MYNNAARVFSGSEPMMKYLLTGATGFLGKNILEVLGKEIDITTLSRSGSDIMSSLEKEVPELPEKYDLVIHTAGKAHSLPITAKQRKAFFDVNVEGTLNLLKALEKAGVPKSFIFISTVAVYGKESGTMIGEDEALAATDPYALSKIKAEELVRNWCTENKVICSILRLPLIAGKNPPGNLGSMIRSLQKGYYFNIAGGNAKKSMVLAKDVAGIIPVVAGKGGIYNLTDGHHPSVYELSKLIAAQLGKTGVRNMPYWIAKPIALLGGLLGNRSPINPFKLRKITTSLTFDDTKARKLLGWAPTAVLDGFKVE